MQYSNTHDMNSPVDFINALFNDCPKELNILIGTTKNMEAFKLSDLSENNLLADMFGDKHKLLSNFADKEDIYFSVYPQNETTNKWPSTETTVGISLVWLDVDLAEYKGNSTKDYPTEQEFQDALELLERKTGIRPFTIVHSGRGLHVYIKLDRFYKLEEIDQDIAKKFQNYFRGLLGKDIDSTGDFARRGRLPFTINSNASPEKQTVTIVHYNEEATVSYQRMVEIVGISATQKLSNSDDLDKVKPHLDNRLLRAAGRVANFGSYEDWIKMAAAYSSEYSGSSEGEQAFIEDSELQPNFGSEDECRTKYQSFKNKRGANNFTGRGVLGCAKECLLNENINPELGSDAQTKEDLVLLTGHFFKTDIERYNQVREYLSTLGFELPEAGEPTLFHSYEECLAWYSENRRLITEGKEICYAVPRHNGEWDIRTKKWVTDHDANKFVRIPPTKPGGKETYRKAFDVYLQSPNRPEPLTGVKFIPGKSGIVDGCLSSWNPPKVLPVENAELAELFIGDNENSLIWALCGGDRYVYEFTLDWLSWKLKNPEKKIGVALVVRGNKGIGKNFLFEHLIGESLFGKHFFLTQDLNAMLSSQFNAGADTHIYAVADEAFFTKDKRLHNRIKGLITSNCLQLEKKGVDAVPANDYRDWIFLTNESLSSLDGAGERRYMHLEALNTFKGNTEHFSHLRKLWFEHGGREAVLYELLNREPNINDLRRPKLSKAGLDNFIQNMDAIDSFIYKMVEEGHNNFDSLSRSWELKVLSTSVSSAYERHVSNHGFNLREKSSTSALYKKMEEYLGCSKRKTSRINGKTASCIEFLPLDTARKRMEETLLKGYPVTWPDEDVSTSLDEDISEEDNIFEISSNELFETLSKEAEKS